MAAQCFRHLNTGLLLIVISTLSFAGCATTTETTPEEQARLEKVERQINRYEHKTPQNALN